MFDFLLDDFFFFVIIGFIIVILLVVVIVVVFLVIKIVILWRKMEFFWWKDDELLNSIILVDGSRGLYFRGSRNEYIYIFMGNYGLDGKVMGVLQISIMYWYNKQLYVVLQY